MGQSNERGDGGIYIGSIMKGGAVAADGRIEPGDMLLQVRGHPGHYRITLDGHDAAGAICSWLKIEPLMFNDSAFLIKVNDINFENMSNDDAVRILREIVSKTG